MIENELAILIAKTLSGEEYKIKKIGEYFLISSRSVKFAIHKNLFKLAKKLKKARLIKALVDSHSNLITV